MSPITRLSIIASFFSISTKITICVSDKQDVKYLKKKGYSSFSHYHLTTNIDNYQVLFLNYL